MTVGATNVEQIAKVLAEHYAVRTKLADAFESVYQSVGEPLLDAGAVIEALELATKPNRVAGGAPGSTERELYEHYGWL